MNKLIKVLLSCMILTLFVQNVPVYAEDSERTIDVVKKELEEAKSIYDISKDAYDAKKAEYDESRKVADEYHDNVFSKQDEYEQLQDNIETMNQNLQSLKDELRNLALIRIWNPGNIQDLENQIQNETDPAKIQNLQEQIQQLQNDLDYANNNFDRIAAESNQMETDLQTLRAKVEPTKENLANIKKQYEIKELIARGNAIELEPLEEQMVIDKGKYESLLEEYNRLIPKDDSIQQGSDTVSKDDKKEESEEKVKEEKSKTVEKDTTTSRIQTGFSSHIYLYSVIMLISAILSALLIFKKLKFNHD